MKRQVKWNRPQPATVGKSQLPIDGEFVYTSKCGRFSIRKRFYSLPCSSVGYSMTDSETGKVERCDTLRDAKDEAEWAIDPNWDCE